jgi:hypothetical protein
MRYFVFITYFIFCFNSKSISQSILDYHPCSVYKEAVMDEKHWKNYLNKTLELDSLATDTIPFGIYKVVAQFIINKEGHITDVKLTKDPGHGLGDRVVKAIYFYNGKCIPSEQNGRKVKAYRKQEITFVIEKHTCNEISPNGFIL